MKPRLRLGIRVGEWRVERLRGLLIGPEDERHRLKPKVMDVLLCLAERAGQTVTRDELIERVWGERGVSDEVLTKAISELRHGLADTAAHPRYIETIPKRGYRLIAPVSPVTGQGTDRPARSLRRPLFLGVLTLIFGILALFLVSALIEDDPDRQPEREVDRNSIAVLPFRNLSRLEEDASFVEGIQDDLLTMLSRIDGLKPISRTSVMRYRDTDKTIPEIAAELGAARLVEGGVQRSADQVRINVQLIDAATDQHLWAASYDRHLNMQNLFAVQSEIVHEIATTLELVLSDRERERLQAMPTVSLEAHGEYFRGQQEALRRTPASLRRAQLHFEKAIELDPEYALAYVGLADSLAHQVRYADLDLEQSFARRQAAIEKALALNPLLGEAFASRGQLRLQQDRREEGIADLEKALELKPGYAHAHILYGHVMQEEGQYEDTLRHTRRAIELDPMNPFLPAALARKLWNLGRMEEAQKAAFEGAKRNPEHPHNYGVMAELLKVMGRINESLQWIRVATGLSPSYFPWRMLECHLLLDLGDDHAAERCYNALEESFADRAFGYRIRLYQFRQQHRQFAELLDEMERRGMPGLAPFFASFDAEKATEIYGRLRPDIVGPGDFTPGGADLCHTAVIASTLHAAGRRERAEYLFAQALEGMKFAHRTRGMAFHVCDVFIYISRDDREMAVAALAEAIDVGWREGWWVLRFLDFQLVREDPRWQELMSELEADIARQRQWYYEHRDDPLF